MTNQDINQLIDAEDLDFTMLIEFDKRLQEDLASALPHLANQLYALGITMREAVANIEKLKKE